MLLVQLLGCGSHLWDQHIVRLCSNYRKKVAIWNGFSTDGHVIWVGSSPFDNCNAEVLDTIKYFTQTYSKKIDYGLVFTATSQLPDNNCEHFSYGDTQVVICVPFLQDLSDLTADVLRRILGHMEMAWPNIRRPLSGHHLHKCLQRQSKKKKPRRTRTRFFLVEKGY